MPGVTNLAKWAAALVVLALTACATPSTSVKGGFAAAGDPRPAYVLALEQAFGAPNRNAFGSTVLTSTAKDRADLEDQARAAYRYFLGDAWSARGEAVWMATWSLAAEGSPPRDIVALLRGLKDPAARSSGDLLLEGGEDAGRAQAALKATFDDAAVATLLVFSIGDGEAMSGLIIAARRTNGEATFLVILMD